MNGPTLTSIFEILKDGNELSISNIKKELDARNIKFHRLTLSGYLNSMADLDILSVKEIKPSKVYSLKKQGAASMYKKIGNIIKELYRDDHGDNCLAFLFYIFNRPVFIREFELCDVDLPKKYKKSYSPKKIQFIKAFRSIGIEIPENEMLIEPEQVNNVYLLKNLKALVLDQFKLLKETPIIDLDQRTLEDI